MFKKKDKEKEKLIIPKDNLKSSMFSKESVRQRVSPGGVNPNPLAYMSINDAGIDIYTRSFYIEKMPKNTQFVHTFEDIFSFDKATVSVFIEPLLDGTAIKHLDRQVLELETEHNAALKTEQPNTIRKNRNKLRKAEQWAEIIESGANRMYEVAFLITIQEKSVDKLNLLSLNLISKAREKSIELVSCYGSEAEAYLSNAPYNKVYKNSKHLLTVPTVKKHIMDKYSLADIYSHTNSHFTHKKGIPIGRNLWTGRPLLYDVYDKSHNGYGVVYCGKTGTGKSATIKISLSRDVPTGYRAAIIDIDRKGNRGEYYTLTMRLGGTVFEITSNSNNILNIYEIDVHDEFDELTGKEFQTLRLLDTIANVVTIIKSMVIGLKNTPEFNDDVYITRIITDIVTEQYADKGIFDGVIESLYEQSNVVIHDKITTGKTKKQLPTISEFYLELCKRQKEDTDPYHAKAYSLIIDVMKDYVRELYYNTITFETYSKDEYRSILENKKDGYENLKCIIGTKSYYDGQSTISLSQDCPITTIDISNLPKDDIPIAQEIALHYLEEHFIKRNSENPNKANKLVVLVDEAHKMFPYPDVRKRISEFYRTSRKRNVSVWTCTQAYADFKGYEETEVIIANATSKFLFKQDYIHRQYLLDNTVLTDSEVSMVIELGGDLMDDTSNRKGEVCLIDNDRVVFLKVDYLVETECAVVETDMNKIKVMYSA